MLFVLNFLRRRHAAKSPRGAVRIEISFRENDYYLALCSSDNNGRAACECFCRRRSGSTRTSAGRWGDMRTCASCSRARTFAQTTFLHSSRSCRRMFRPAGSAFFVDFLMHACMNELINLYFHLHAPNPSGSHSWLISSGAGPSFRCMFMHACMHVCVCVAIRTIRTYSNILLYFISIQI